MRWGIRLEVKPLNWGKVEDVCAGQPGRVPRALLLDRVTDPHNVGAILRSAEVFGATAVIAPRHHSAPETGALAKSASGALERQPYVRVTNLAQAIERLQAMGYLVLGLDGTAAQTVESATEGRRDAPAALVLGADARCLRCAGADRFCRGVRLAQRIERGCRGALCQLAEMSRGLPGGPGIPN
jgi:23S rRNA (guanosine2251-2'-O)-methyltransferase